MFFDKKEDKLKVLCKEHLCECTHLCSDGKFLCIYCLHRIHKKHAKDTIGNEAAKIKEALLKESNEMEHVCELLKVTQDHILVSKKKLDESLRERKAACLSSYVDLLNKEEEVIRAEFQNICYNHIEKYPMANSTEYYQEKLLQDDIQLTMEKTIILDDISENSITNSSLGCVVVSLSDTADFLNEHPLGDIHVTVSEEISFCHLHPPVSTLKEKIYLINDYENILSSVTAKVKQLLQEGRCYVQVDVSYSCESVVVAVLIAVAAAVARAGTGAGAGTRARAGIGTGTGAGAGAGAGARARAGTGAGTGTGAGAGARARAGTGAGAGARARAGHCNCHRLLFIVIVYYHIYLCLFICMYLFVRCVCVVALVSLRMAH